MSKIFLHSVKTSFPNDKTYQNGKYIEAVTENNIRLLSVFVPKRYKLESFSYYLKLSFLALLEERLQCVANLYKQPLFVGGTFNIAPKFFDVHNTFLWDNCAFSSKLEYQFFDKLLRLGFYDLVYYKNLLKITNKNKSFFTFWNNSSYSKKYNLGFRIDHLLSNNCIINNIISADVDTSVKLYLNTLTHAPIICSFFT